MEGNTVKSCLNCKNRYTKWGIVCFGFEISEDDEAMAATCKEYQLETDEEREARRCTSATAGDYSPSNPWDAPGMSISDFL